MSGTSNKPSALVPGKRKTPPESSTPRVSPLLRNAGPSISDYDTSNEASNGLIVNSSYEHLFNLAAKYEQARLTISGQSTKIAAMVKDNETLKTELAKAQTTIAEQGASITRLSDALTHIKDGAVAAAENMLANIKTLKVSTLV
ncbi:hypothetical protein A4X06_0g6003 [Tilletia controversa]|uniref:Uncharacterized protein n=1 Tax=Tilletia controversa TaxID=13291 RepID=A0A8X7MQH2_9BASI|nr:hypothetical protein A4X06_0g6003 [Tilletia controversa]